MQWGKANYPSTVTMLRVDELVEERGRLLRAVECGVRFESDAYWRAMQELCRVEHELERRRRLFAPPEIDRPGREERDATNVQRIDYSAFPPIELIRRAEKVAASFARQVARDDEECGNDTSVHADIAADHLAVLRTAIAWIKNPSAPANLNAVQGVLDALQEADKQIHPTHQFRFTLNKRVSVFNEFSNRMAAAQQGAK